MPRDRSAADITAALISVSRGRDACAPLARQGERTKPLRLLRAACEAHGEIVRHPGKIAQDGVVVDDLGAELNARHHDIGRARGKQVDAACVLLPRLDAAALQLAMKPVALDDEAAAEFGGIPRERNLVVLLDEHLVANGGVGRPCAVEIESPRIASIPPYNNIIAAKRVGGRWLVDLNSLRGYLRRRYAR